ncbi:ABC transporter ATP-binding protein [Curtobacterium flaccumfaciens]|uniref:ABC transporter ATP-binding protein n=1 Tax=Curtobacterium flaccumfaciens TaxID=2035 RepID=UPI002032F92E|nr:ABC transporter ATP-binding protein [Curtobacterium flaccumfaciens]MCS0471241.1 ATP-binding cassette domain-containing protein [Curtobacterium flaccumfaciens pv. betae]MCS0474064.1 ATP-binding cassette domain-containing protein [Curtobacterium flaccumfaciens pv. betae]MCS0477629.1 ATP-binding cassette domain-containing protein [Curtobacterium flaccumfaciens pv. betae]MCS0482299.1 ATP-binding cassette domain-containing protein [Curtobacterium flaccumfaciens pv. betae]MCS0484941.1 ATP-binding
MPARAENEDVYATADAAWMTEAGDADEADTAAAAEGDAADDDTGDTDADDAATDDAMTDATTDTRTDATTDTRTDGATTDTRADATTDTRTDASTDDRIDDAAAAAPRPAKARNGKGRTKRPTKAAPRTDAEPPVPTDADDVTDDAGRATTATPPATKKRAPRSAAPKQPQTLQPVVLAASGLVKRYGQTLAVDEVDLEIRQGSIFGVVGPNGAGKTTTLSMITGLLRPDAGSVTVLDHDVWADPTAAKRSLGVLPDRLRLFDRLTGAQLLYYSATLRGLDGATARKRSADLAEAFGLGEALGRQVADYSVGMAKKIALAATLIHSPRVLVLDEPFESVDPVSAATITDILRRYTRGGGTVVLSSHSMELVQRTCDSVAIIVGGKVLASGTMAQVRGRKSLEDKFVELAGGRVVAESMEWLHSFSG